LNRLDLWVRQGLPNVSIPLPHIPGSDVAGEIAQVGADVTTVRIGQKVVLAPGVTCGKCAACLAGLDNRCRDIDGEIRHKNGSTRVDTLRKTYGARFASDFRGDMKLDTLLDRSGASSLSDYLRRGR